MVDIGNRIWRGTLFVATASLLMRLGTFLSSVVTIRLLGAEQVGQLGLIESWLSCLSMCALMGIGPAVTKYVSEYLDTDPERAGGLAGAALLLGGGISLVVAGAVWLGLRAGGFAFAGTTQQVLGNYAFLVLWLILALSLKQVLLGLVYGVQAFPSLVTANAVVGVIAVPVSYLLVRGRGLEGALAARLALTVVEAFVLAGAARATLRSAGVRVRLGEGPPLDAAFASSGVFHRLRGLGRSGRQLLGFGLPAFLGQLAASPVQSLAMAFLAAQPGGLAQLGFLTTANRLASLPGFVPGSVATTLLPVLSGEWGRGQRSRFQEGTWLALRGLWLSTLPVTLFFLAASPALLRRLYGDVYAGAWPVAFVLIAMTLLVSINETGDRSLAAAGRMWLSTGNNVVWTGLFFLGAVTLIPRQLALGYAVAFLVSFAFYVGLQLWWLRRLFGMRLVRLAPMLLVTAPLLLAAWLIARHTAGWVQVGLAGMLAGAAVGIEWRLFPTSGEREALRRRWRRAVAAGTALPRRVRSLVRTEG